MADFVAVLKKTLDGMGETTPSSRQRVYEKARQTIAAKLAAINPPPPQAVADRQRRAMEDAIATVEKTYEAKAKKSDPLAELEDVFASLKNPQPKTLETPTAKTGARPASTISTPAPTAPSSRPAVARPVTTPVPPLAERQSAPPETNRPAQTQQQQQREQAPPPPRQPVAAPAPDSSRIEAGDAPPDYSRRPSEPVRRRNLAPFVVAAVLLAVVVGAGYGIWLNRAAFTDLLSSGESTQTAQVPSDVTPVQDDDADAPAEEPTNETPKFTQRLTPEGTEIDAGPADGGATIGEGTSVSTLTQPPGIDPSVPAPDGQVAPDGATAQPAQSEDVDSGSAVAVAQKAIFYEERTTASEGSAEPGTTVWSLVQESPGADLPPEPAIRAQVSVPDKDVQLRMTIRRNADESLPASHIIEMIFLTPENFQGGGIENILRIALKGSEQEAGNPLIGIPVKIADGFFLVALNDSKAETEANLTLLRRQSWIDVPVVYKSGRRALFTMEKGVPGDKVFEEALKAWAAATADTSEAAPG